MLTGLRAALPWLGLAALLLLLLSLPATATTFHNLHSQLNKLNAELATIKLRSGPAGPRGPSGPRGPPGPPGPMPFVFWEWEHPAGEKGDRFNWQVECLQRCKNVVLKISHDIGDLDLYAESDRLPRLRYRTLFIADPRNINRVPQQFQL